MLVLVSIAYSVLAVAPPPDLVGTIRFVDGDTLDVGQARVRLHAIDAPETDQLCTTDRGKQWACGGWISKVVADRYDGETAACDILDTDRYGRTVAQCRALGRDIGAWLLREGFAFAYVKYGVDYVAIEGRASTARRGLHAVQVQNPAAFRARGRREATPPDGNCVIKGNISADGTRIYHMPGQTFYDRTRISARKGERWFCSAAAAESEGWRAARR
ncbi:thermonuclease family protein [uncultured Sulfitobacter sp.]|uniref:thermonuclease family protein n=1 Tax=uncultured Sulfitobacter sp. TaxID=191468 RepID=UPI002637E38F|nr:thermonuclease family protein [uncultured Sulfitobacter sp.]